jgi:large subunit ribosomal protein L12
MEYVYATLLIESAEREITEERLTAVLEAAHVEVNPKRIHALLSSWEQIEFDRDSYTGEPTVDADADDEVPSSGELKDGETDAPELAESDVPELDGEETPELEDGEEELELDGEEEPESGKEGKELGTPGESTSYGELRGLRMEAEEDKAREADGDEEKEADNDEDGEETEDEETEE